MLGGLFAEMPLEWLISPGNIRIRIALPRRRAAFIGPSSMAKRRAGKTANRKPRIAGGTPGELLKLRTEKGLTGEELARRLGTSQATVSKMETGFQKPTMDY